MALIKCPECGKDVSDTVASCPHCGYQLKQTTGSALFKCAEHGGWGPAVIKQTVDLIDVSNGAIIKSFQMGGVVNIPIPRKTTIRIHVHNYMGKPEVTLYPGQSVYVNITLKAGGMLGGGFCNAEVVPMGAGGAPSSGSSSGGTPTVSGGGGCYVATCVYGSYDCPQVWVLRRFRDYKLSRSVCGRLFIKVYYAISPTLVRWFGKTEWFKRMWRGKLDRMVRKYKAQGYLDTPYQDLY